MKNCILLFLLVSPSIFAQSFTIRVSPKIIGKEDILQVEYVADNVTIDQFNMPQFVNWSIVSGPSQSNTEIRIGTSVRKQTILSILLTPKIAGTIVIPGATALINSKPLRSNDATVQVKNVSHVGNVQTQPTNQPSAPLFDLSPLPAEVSTNQYLRKGENAVEKIKRNMFVRLELSKQSCYVGEPFMATYKLCTRLRANSKVTKQPTFSGCTVVELTPNYQEQHIEKINGQEYNVFVIRRVQLIPLDAGQLTLPATSVENKVSFHNPKAETDYDVYGNATRQSEEEHVVTIESSPSSISIKPLPPYTGTEPFSGVVGNFSLALKAAESSFMTTGTNHLFLLIEGTGNLQPAKCPAIAWPKGIESFEPTENAETDKESDPILTRKVFTIPFVADKTGSYVLPPIPFIYFNPNSEKYVPKSTPAFLFKVETGSKGIANNVLTKNLQDFDQRLFVLLGAGLLAVIIGITWYSGTKRSKMPLDIKTNEDEVLPVAPIEKVQRVDGMGYLYKIRELVPSGNTSEFYKQLGKILNDYLLIKYVIKPSEIDEFARQNENISIPLHKLKSLVDNCTTGMYTPIFNMEEALGHRLDSLDVLNKLESY